MSKNEKKMSGRKKKQHKIEKSTDDIRTSTSENEFSKHKWDKLAQQNKNNLFSNILYAVDRSFNCFRHFVGMQNV